MAELRAKADAELLKVSANMANLRASANKTGKQCVAASPCDACTLHACCMAASAGASSPASYLSICMLACVEEDRQCLTVTCAGCRASKLLGKAGSMLKDPFKKDIRGVSRGPQ